MTPGPRAGDGRAAFEAGPARLAAHHRLFAALAATTVLALVLGAKFVIPAVWARPWLRQHLLRPCVLRSATGVPCPFCGATRATVLAAHGDWQASLRLHPAGVVIVFGGGAIGVWMAVCAVSGFDLGAGAAARAVRRIASVRMLVLLLLFSWMYTIISQSGR